MGRNELGGIRYKKWWRFLKNIAVLIIFLFFVISSVQAESKSPPDAGFKIIIDGDNALKDDAVADQIKSVSVKAWDNHLVICMVSDGPINNYRSFVLENPPRIVIELYKTKSPAKGLQTAPIEYPWASGVSLIGNTDKARLVIDTKKQYLHSFSAEPYAIGMLIKVGDFKAKNNIAGHQAPATKAVAGTEIANGGPIDKSAPGPSAADPTAEQAGQVAEKDGILTFEIKSFAIAGNTVLSLGSFQNVLKPFIGDGKTADDVENARTALENFYHRQGYPTVLVNIPEQTVEEGVVQLQVIESKIRRVRITGNRYFTMEMILRKLPSFRAGEILYLPKIQEELADINRNPDLKVAPVLTAGKTLGTIDVELRVKDKLPLHASAELNNRSTHDTTELRSNGLISYDNLWQKEHSVSFQYQTSPLDRDEVRAIAGSYVSPAPWGRKQMLALYGLYSDSETAFGQGFQTIGKGRIFGVRNMIPLPPVGKYSHNLSVGLDYKDFDDDLTFATGGLPQETPVTYLPLAFSYNSSLNHHSGTTMFSGGLNMVFRNLVSDPQEFENKRFESRGNYIYATVGVERYQPLPLDMNLYVKLDGQIADQPLISNEQYFAGGLRSVRGYKEVEEAGDNAFHTISELSYPNIGKLVGLWKWWDISPYIFLDYAYLRLKDVLPGEDKTANLMGTGAGVRGYMTRYFEYELAWGHALRSTERTDRGKNQIYFVFKAQI
jgi:hemolysin activation/secretion protein